MEILPAANYFTGVTTRVPDRWGGVGGTPLPVLKTPPPYVVGRENSMDPFDQAAEAYLNALRRQQEVAMSQASEVLARYKECGCGLDHTPEVHRLVQQLEVQAAAEQDEFNRRLTWYDAQVKAFKQPPAYGLPPEFLKMLRDAGITVQVIGVDQPPRG